MPILEDTPTVAVLLSVYNGEAYLDALLASLLAQSYAAFHILVRDDGSSDGTLSLLARVGGDRLSVVRDDEGRLGPAGSFLRLLGEARADVYMFCDQDDVWLPDKVENAVAALRASGIDQPVLYHTDLTVVDEQLEMLSPSFHRHEGLRFPEAHDISRLAVQNCAVGCTMAVTDALVRLAHVRDRRPTAVAMHDWWLALLASCVGTIVYSPDASILYRQHSLNVSGARKRSRWRQIRTQLSPEGVERIRAYTTKIAAQARSFLAFYRGELPARAEADLEAVARLDDPANLAGLWTCARRGIRLQNAHMNAAIVYSALVTRALAIGARKSASDAVRAP